MAKRIKLLLLFGLLSFGFVNYAHAYTTTFTKTFTPCDADIADLAHEYYYTWGINWAIPEGQYITEATLTFKNIYDWTVEDSDHLYTHLLDNPKPGIKSYWDNQGNGDNFAGQGVLVGDWSDPAGGKQTGFNLVYTFSTLGLLDELTDYLNTPQIVKTNKHGKVTYRSADFGFGFDPDCHYYNNGVEFTITTAATPEPASISLLGMGLLGLLGLRRKKR